MATCPFCEYAELIVGEPSCPNCLHELIDHWNQVGKAPVKETPPFDPFGQLAEPTPAVPATPVEDSSPAKAAVETPPPSPPLAPGIVCPNPACQAMLARDARFCDKCGTVLAPKCSKCGRDNRAGAKFCTFCGQPLGSAATPPVAMPASIPPVASGEDLLPPWATRKSPQGVVQRLQLVAFGKDGAESCRFDLKDGDNRIGAKSLGEGINPDVDLGPLDADKVISRRHAVLRVETGRLTLTDQGSTNGTLVNGQRLARDVPVPVDEGSDIVFANIRCRLHGQ